LIENQEIWEMLSIPKKVLVKRGGARGGDNYRAK